MRSNQLTHTKIPENNQKTKKKNNVKNPQTNQRQKSREVDEKTGIFFFQNENTRTKGGKAKKEMVKR